MSNKILYAIKLLTLLCLPAITISTRADNFLFYGSNHRYFPAMTHSYGPVPAFTHSYGPVTSFGNRFKRNITLHNHAHYRNHFNRFSHSPHGTRFNRFYDDSHDGFTATGNPEDLVQAVPCQGDCRRVNALHYDDKRPNHTNRNAYRRGYLQGYMDAHRSYHRYHIHKNLR